MAENCFISKQALCVLQGACCFVLQFLYEFATWAGLGYDYSMDMGKNILVVDDDVIVTSALKTFFRVEGINNFVMFNNPIEAVEYLRENKPCIIISDFMMPQMNGLEFLTAAKELWPDVSMILLTGYADKENAIRAINEVGLYRYIEKPWDNDDLLINIKNGIERSYLVEKLNEKISELEVANRKLEEYSNNLEQLVAERTKSLAVANMKLAGIIENCADGIILLDKNGNIEEVNPACENFIGYSAKNLTGMSLSEFVEFETLAARQRFVDEEGFLPLLNSDKSEILIKDLYLVNGLSKERIPVEINFAICSLAEDDRRFVGVIRDVHVQKETEKLRDDFIATLTHDMRTPLLAAIQTLRFFLEGAVGGLTDQQKMLLSTMLQSNEDLLGLVNALLEVYRFESGKLALVKTNFPVKNLINQCYEEIKPLADSKDLALELVFETGENPCIYADRGELKRVIINLCGNAVNYTNKGGTIKLVLKENDDDIIFSVIDNGNGIPKEDIPHLFKRFSQGTSKKRSTGTGLGLYLSRQIIEAHNGKIWVESKLDKGSEFSFLLTDVVTTEKERQEING